MWFCSGAFWPYRRYPASVLAANDSIPQPHSMTPVSRFSFSSVRFIPLMPNPCLHKWCASIMIPRSSVLSECPTLSTPRPPWSSCQCIPRKYFRNQRYILQFQCHSSFYHSEPLLAFLVLAFFTPLTLWAVCTLGCGNEVGSSCSSLRYFRRSPFCLQSASILWC